MPYRSLARRVGNAVRLAEIVQVLIKHGFVGLVRRTGLYEGIPAKILRTLHLIEPPSTEPETQGTRLRAALMELGPTFVKFGQILSTRPDVLGRDLCAALTHLQDRVTPLPFETIEKVIIEDLGAPVISLFGKFDSEPVASASLSQVYRAQLKNGRAVAVKVQRPRSRATIQSDLNIIREIALWVDEHVPDMAWMHLPGMVEEFDRSVMRELDFTVEARIIERFHANYANDDGVFIPTVYEKLSSQRVLTMDWVDGLRIDAVSRYPERNCDAKTVAAKGCETLCKQVFEFHLFHADPHPGNIFVLRNNVIAFLDYGMVGHLERSDANGIADLLRAVMNEDAAACMQTVLAFVEDSDSNNTDQLEHDIADFLAFEARAVVSRGELGRAIEQISQILAKHHLKLAPRFALLLKALATVESTGHVLDPDLDMIPLIRPHVEKAVRDRYSPMALARDVRHNAASLLRLGRQIPQDLQQVLRLLKGGRFKVTMQHVGLDHLSNVTDRASNRITFGLIAGSLIIGSSLLMFNESGARHIGMGGFVGAGILGLALLVSILRSRNF